jgi:simple sugar transport system substrate-binding protein
MSKELFDDGAGIDDVESFDELAALTRRDVFVKGGLLAAGAAFLGSPVAAASAAANRGARGPKSMKIAVITHGQGDAFWVVAKKGATAAGRDLGISVLYSESGNKPQRQAQLIDTAVSQKVKGIATSLPDPSAMRDSLARARRAKIALITLNSGLQQYKSLGAITHVGQTEQIAGAGAGAKFSAAGLKNLLVVIHEQGNIGLEQRYSGAKSKLKGKTSRLQVKGVADLAGTTAQIRTKLTADKSIDSILTLNPQIATAALNAAKGARSKAKIGTFDLSGDVITAIQKGQMLFAIDQQQYMQGYLPVVFLYLYNTNLNTVGGGQPVLTGPGFVDKSNAARVAALAKKGTR